jgi:hypothetical protein
LDGSSSDSNSSEPKRSLLWIDDCPCLGCPYDENGECVDLKYCTSCAYIERWVLGLRLHSPNKKDTDTDTKKQVISKRPLRWKMHRFGAPRKNSPFVFA